MLIPSHYRDNDSGAASLSRRVNANSQQFAPRNAACSKLIKKGEC